MAFRSETYRILIASPSELTKEREAAVKAINDWNATNAENDRTVLLPVRWETHAIPQMGIRPQEAINVQLAASCDIVVGMFWTKLGTSTGVAESGTVEELDEFVKAGKPALLYFSNRPVDPSKINLAQNRKLRRFKERTCRRALIGHFGTVDGLRHLLLRDLTRQIQRMRDNGRSRTARIEQAFALTELLERHRKHRIAPEQFETFRAQVLGLRRAGSRVPSDPVKPGELGPSGYRVGYNKIGDKVEFMPDLEHPDKEWEMLLRRNDRAIQEAYRQFWDKGWWNRHQNWLFRIKTGAEPLTTADEPVLARAKIAAKRIERKYGKENLGWDDFEWGLLSGRMSALAWVMGADWGESLDT